MDPNAAWCRLRELTQELTVFRAVGCSSECEAADTLFEVATLIEGLNDWFVCGGSRPQGIAAD